MSDRIVIIGSNSKLGISLVEYLIKKKINIVGISRGKNINKNIFEYYNIDYDEITNWHNVIKKNDTIIHLAYDQKHISETIKAEENLFSFCKKTKISKLVYLSTIKVFGENYIDGPLDEMTKCNPATEYAKKKFLIEKKLIDQFSVNCSSKYIILRLPIVYGENILNNLSRLINLIKIFRLNPFKNIKNKRSFLSKELLNKVILELINIQDLKNSIFCVADKSAISTYNYINNEFIQKKFFVLNIDLNFLISFLFKIFSKKVFYSIYGTLYMETSKLNKLLKK